MNTSSFISPPKPMYLHFSENKVYPGIGLHWLRLSHLSTQPGPVYFRLLPPSATGPSPDRCKTYAKQPHGDGLSACSPGDIENPVSSCLPVAMPPPEALPERSWRKEDQRRLCIHHLAANVCTTSKFSDRHTTKWLRLLIIEVFDVFWVYCFGKKKISFLQPLSC